MEIKIGGLILVTEEELENISSAQNLYQYFDHDSCFQGFVQGLVGARKKYLSLHGNYEKYEILDKIKSFLVQEFHQNRWSQFNSYYYYDPWQYPSNVEHSDEFEDEFRIDFIFQRILDKSKRFLGQGSFACHRCIKKPRDTFYMYTTGHISINVKTWRVITLLCQSPSHGPSLHLVDILIWSLICLILLLVWSTTVWVLNLYLTVYATPYLIDDILYPYMSFGHFSLQFL